MVGMWQTRSIIWFIDTVCVNAIYRRLFWLRERLFVHRRPRRVDLVLHPWRRVGSLSLPPLVFQQSGLDHEVLLFFREVAADVVADYYHAKIHRLDHCLQKV